MSKPKRKTTGKVSDKNKKTSRKCGFFNKANTSIQTPKDLYDALNEEYNFDFDPCPLDEEPKWDGLKIAWKKSNFINPPFNNIKPWVEKAVDEAVLNGNKSVMLIPFRPDTICFTENVFRWATNIYLFSKRIAFEKFKSPLPIPMSIVVFEPNLMHPLKKRKIEVQTAGLPEKDFGDYITTVIK
jgi:hypothetical protein